MNLNKMDNLKKPETVIGLINTAALLGATFYFYRKTTNLEVELNKHSENLTSTIKKVKDLYLTKKHIATLAGAIKNQNNVLDISSRDIEILKEIIRVQASQITELQNLFSTLRLKDNDIAEIKLKDNPQLRIIAFDSYRRFGNSINTNNMQHPQLNTPMNNPMNTPMNNPMNNNNPNYMSHQYAPQYNSQQNNTQPNTPQYVTQPNTPQYVSQQHNAQYASQPNTPQYVSQPNTPQQHNAQLNNSNRFVQQNPIDSLLDMNFSNQPANTQLNGSANQQYGFPVNGQMNGQMNMPMNGQMNNQRYEDEDINEDAAIDAVRKARKQNEDPFGF